MSSILDPHVTVEQISSWDALYVAYTAFGKDVRRWIFRGQKLAKWGLETSLERTVRRFGHPSTLTPTIEDGVIRRFQRQTHHYTVDVPKKDSLLEWLSLMQHHGAPTRLQDWTYSFFVACFFAIEDTEEDAAIWALDRTVTDPAVLQSVPSGARSCIDETGYIDTRACFAEIFKRNPAVPMVSPVNPFRVNQRLVIQQGIFLCPGDVASSFEENLAAVLPRPPHQSLRKLVIDGSAQVRTELLWQLQRMNMNRATLFPGLDGFAASLKTLVAFPEIIPAGKDAP
jgi:hypothetical protein